MKRALSLVALVGCSPHRVYEHPNPPVQLPESFGGERAGSPAVDRWWQAFGDAELDALIARAVQASPRMHVAWARLKQAKASADGARAPRWPRADVQASAAYRENFFPPFGTIDQRTYSLSMPVSYEVDVWNRYGAGASAAAANVRATRDDAEAVAMSLAAEVSEAWFDVINALAQKKLLEAQLEINTTFEELIRLRFERGIGAAIDVYQQRQQRLVTEAQLALVEGNHVLALNRLAVLAGEPPQRLRVPVRDELPSLPALPDVGVPADLLERRPDLRAMRERIVAQDYQLAAAIAARLPSLVVNGSLSFSSTTPQDILDTLLKSISGTLSAPLFDGGLRAAEARRQRAALEEVVASYGQVLLQALNEVDSALSREKQESQSLEVLKAQRSTAEATLREARARYEQGLTDYLPVLTALASLQNTERSLLDADRRRLSARVQLCRALGGTWTVALAPPPRGREGRRDPS